MKQKVESFIIVCDCCGDHFHDCNDHCCYIDDPNGEIIEQVALDSCWISIGEKHFCEKCYSIDDNDNIVTRDGHIYDPETNKLIK